MFQAGSVLNARYRIDAHLERSQLGDLYLATDLTAQMPVALRLLAADLAANADFLRQLAGLAPELADLGHPGIVRFYALEQFDGHPAIITEYVPGLTLQRRLLDARRALPLAEAAAILEQVAGAISDAHRHDIVHGSLQPADIVLESGTALASFVENFGIALAAQRAGLPAMAVGNPTYLSPEQFGAGELGPAADVYSLGVILYEMVTGQPPFSGAWGEGDTTDERLAAEHLALPPTDPQRINPGLPPGAASVILRALEKQPAERWPDAAALVGAWRQALPPGIAPEVAARSTAPLRAATGQAGRPTTLAPLAPVGEVDGRGAWPWPLIALTLAALSVALLAWVAFGRFGGRQGEAAFAAGNAASAAGPTAATGAAATATGRPTQAVPANSAPGTLTSPTAGGPETPSGPSPAPDGGPYALTLVPANVRAGPGTDSPVIGSLNAATRVPIVGRNAAGDWWQICCVNNAPGWVFANLVSTAGALESVPVIEAGAPAQAPPTSAPASPTATPAAEAVVTPSPMPGSEPIFSPAPPIAAAPAPTPTQCPPVPAGAFDALPAEGLAALGCQVAGPLETHFSHQYFQHGQMVYRYDLRVIYVLYADGAWAAYPDVYVEGQPWQQGDFTPPAGLKAPIKGFDRVWERPEVRAKIGWATRDELGVIPGEAASFQRGLAVRLDYPGYLTGFFVLLSGGRSRQY